MRVSTKHGLCGTQQGVQLGNAVGNRRPALSDDLRKHGVLLLHRLQNIPCLFKVSPLKRLFNGLALLRLKEQRKEDETGLLTINLPHRAASRLNNVHLALARRKECNDIDGGNVHAFSQVPRVRHDGAIRLPKRSHLLFTARGLHLTINVVDAVIGQVGLNRLDESPVKSRADATLR